MGFFFINISQIIITNIFMFSSSLMLFDSRDEKCNSRFSIQSSFGKAETSSIRQILCKSRLSNVKAVDFTCWSYFIAGVVLIRAGMRSLMSANNKCTFVLISANKCSLVLISAHLCSQVLISAYQFLVVQYSSPQVVLGSQWRSFVWRRQGTTRQRKWCDRSKHQLI